MVHLHREASKGDEGPTEEKEHLEVVKAKRELLFLEDPALSYATQVQIARLKLEEAELKLRIRKKKSLRYSMPGGSQSSSSIGGSTNVSSMRPLEMYDDQLCMDLTSQVSRDFIPPYSMGLDENAWTRTESNTASFEMQQLIDSVVSSPSMEPWQRDEPSDPDLMEVDLPDMSLKEHHFGNCLSAPGKKYQSIPQGFDSSSSSLSDAECYVPEDLPQGFDLGMFDQQNLDPLFGFQGQDIVQDSGFHLEDFVELTSVEVESSPQASEYSVQSVSTENPEPCQSSSSTNSEDMVIEEPMIFTGKNEFGNSHKARKTEGNKKKHSLSTASHGSFQCLVLGSPKSKRLSAPRIRTTKSPKDQELQMVVKPGSDIAGKRQTGVEIPGTSCFNSRPNSKKHRKENSELDRARIRLLRLKGACLRCRANHWVCSEEDPCKKCLQTSATPAPSSQNVLFCVRSVSDCNPFAYFEAAGFGSLALVDLKIPRGYQARDCASTQVRCLTFFDRVTGADGNQRSNLSWTRLPLNWGPFGSRILTALDKVIKNKKFWSRQQVTMQFMIVAAIDLIISLLLHVAEWSAKHGLSIDGVRHPSTYPDHQLPQRSLQELCDSALHCIERLLALRTIVLERLEAWASGSLSESTRYELFSGYLEESAIRCLTFVQQYFHSPSTDCLSMAIRQLHSQGFSTNSSPTASKQKLLGNALALNKASLIQHALTVGADPSILLAHRSWRFSALHAAVANGDRTLIQQLLKAGADTESRAWNDWTPLQVATTCRADWRKSISRCRRHTERPGSVDYRYADIVTLLLEYNADCEAKDFEGKTALHLAAEYDHPHILEVLLKFFANGNAKTHRGRTPLHIALDNPRSRTIDRLIHYDTDLNAQDADGLLPIHIAARKRSRTLRVLLDRCKKVMPGDVEKYVNQTTPEGATPLDFAIICRDSESVRILIDAGANMSPRDRERKYLWQRDMRLNSILRHGPSKRLLVDERLVRSDAPLHKAAAHGTPSLTKFLLQAGAEVDAKDRLGFTPLHAVCQYMSLHRHPNARLKALTTCMLGAGADINARGSNGETVLHLIADNPEAAESVSFLVDYGLDVNARDERGRTPLHIAALANGTETIARRLLSAGAEIDAQDSNGATPLHLATRGGRMQQPF